MLMLGVSRAGQQETRVRGHYFESQVEIYFLIMYIADDLEI